MTLYLNLAQWLCLALAWLVLLSMVSVGLIKPNKLYSLDYEKALLR